VFAYVKMVFYPDDWLLPIVADAIVGFIPKRRE
jgi:hypothetical protein